MQLTSSSGGFRRWFVLACVDEMAYIDGFVMAVPTADKQRFVEYARRSNPVLKELGAIRSMDSWGDDVPVGERTDFRKAVNAQDHETVVFSWVEWPDRETRDRGMAQLQKLAETDERFDRTKYPVPFDSSRMIMGGFEVLVEV